MSRAMGRSGARNSHSLRMTVLAAAVGSGLGFSGQAAAQLEEVIVTGSLIRGTPVDAALPVEVYTAEDMELSGSPTALEFAKSLTVSGPTTGESYYFSGAGLTGSLDHTTRMCNYRIT